MRRLIASAVFGVRVTVFALTCLLASPLVLFYLGVGWLRERVESRWPDSHRARAVSFWVELLAPVLLIGVLTVALPFAITWVRAHLLPPGSTSFVSVARRSGSTRGRPLE